IQFAGEFYAVSDLNGFPKPLQQPRPPIAVGGGGKLLLSVAAREADIVGLNVKAKPDGSGQDWSDATEAATTRKLAWMKEAAGERFDHLEINVMNHNFVVTTDRAQAAAQVSERLKLPKDEILSSPHCLIGTVEQICDDLLLRREHFGISY